MKRCTSTVEMSHRRFPPNAGKMYSKLTDNASEWKVSIWGKPVAQRIAPQRLLDSGWSMGGLFLRSLAEVFLRLPFALAAESSRTHGPKCGTRVRVRWHRPAKCSRPTIEPTRPGCVYLACEYFLSDSVGEPFSWAASLLSGIARLAFPR